MDGMDFQCAGLHIAAAPQIACDTASCIVLAFCAACVNGRLIYIDILVTGAMLTDECQTMHFATPFGTH